MKIVGIYNLLFCLLVICSCSDKKNTENYKKNELNFSEVDTVIVHKTDSCVFAENWMLLDGEIICKTSSASGLYTVIDNKTLGKKYVFGVKGHGRNEWIAPHIIANKLHELFVYDNGDKKLYSVKENNINYVKNYNIKDAINDAKAIEYPIIGFVSMTPRVQSLRLMNIENENFVDSISFIDPTNNGNSSLYDFVWSSHDDKIVIAHQHSDRYIVCKTNSKHKIVETTIFDTDGKFSAESFTYSGVACGRYIYLLSQKKVNPETVEGFSEVEIYDYDGTCVKKLVMNIIADKMLVDEKNNRMLFTSVEDGSINIVNLR